MSLAAPRESPPPSHDADPNVTLPRKVRDVTPRYPPVAYARRLEGVVRIQADINEDGRVVNARVVTSSAPEFDGPALEAIRQWEFTPTLLDGVPVSVPMTTDIKFSLR